MITIATAATIPTTAPADMLLPFSEGAGKSARLLYNSLIRSQHGDHFKLPQYKGFRGIYNGFATAISIASATFFFLSHFKAMQRFAA